MVEKQAKPNADVWLNFHDGSRTIADEDDAIVRLSRKGLYLRAYCDYKEPGSMGERETRARPYVFGQDAGNRPVDSRSRPNESFQERFRALAARAEDALGVRRAQAQRTFGSIGSISTC